MKPGFWAAMASYFALAIIAGLLLDGNVRWSIWILLAGLAVKTWIARAAGW